MLNENQPQEGRWLSLALMLACLAVIGPGLAAATAPADAALAALAAADADRQQLAKERQAWALEAQALQALIDSLQAEQQALQTQEANQQRELASLRVASVSEQELDAQETAVAELERILAGLIAERLAEVAKTSMPGAIASAAGETFAARADALRQSEVAAQRVAVELVDGQQQDGSLRAVRLLRIGGALGWWRDLAGEQAGPARMTDGVLRLLPGRPADQPAILRAFAIAEGRVAPTFVSLPVERQP